jgi:hypothetical protein
MNKRESVAVVFRIVAVLILLLLTIYIPTSFKGSDVVGIVVVFLAASFLWFKSLWLADKVIAPFAREPLSAPGMTEANLVDRGTLSLTEMETVSLTVIGIYLFVTMLPSIVIYGVALIGSSTSISYGILLAFSGGLAKLFLGLFLALKSSQIINWINRRRKIQAF